MNTILNHNRNINLFIAVGLVIALVVVAAFVITTSATVTTNAVPNVSQNVDRNEGELAVAPLSADAFPQYRQSEWHSGAVTNASGLDAYHQSERTLIPAQAGLTAYHLSERTMTEPIAVNDLSQYFVSERTLVDPLAGWATYLESERTSIPVQFTPYQISEWFGR